MFINRELFPKVVSVLVTHMGNVNQRRTHLNNALYGEDMLNRITWEGPAYEFTSALVDVVNRHGTVDDMIVLLQVVRDSLGMDDRPAFDDLITALRPPEPEPDPDEYSYARTASAALVEIPEIDLELPDVPLVGRDAIKSDLLTLLNDSKHVLVYGFSGSGKTALASTVALEWMDAGNGEVLYVKAGAAETDALLEAVGRAFDAGKAVAAERDDTGRMRVIAKLLRGHNISLVVVDDAWNGPALLPLLRAATRRAVLVTARKHIPITGEHRPIPQMRTDDALTLLQQHIGSPLAADHTADARTLCEKLGNHPFALRVLGK
ncbi:MAG: NB-ARC domain-containing protein, partial [Chloroflexota bacterium]